MNGLAMLGIWTAVAAAIAAVAGWVPLQIWLECHDKLAAWAQAVFSVIAILASVGIVRWQHRRETEQAKAAASEERLRGETDVLSMLQYIAARLTEAIRDASFQLADAENPTIYWDPAGEFRVLRETIEKLPLSGVLLHGQLDTYLFLRRSADELAELHAGKPERGVDFHKKNRNRLDRLISQCRKLKISLANEISIKDPVLYEKRRDAMLDR